MRESGENGSCDTEDVMADGATESSSAQQLETQQFIQIIDLQDALIDMPVWFASVALENSRHSQPPGRFDVERKAVAHHDSIAGGDSETRQGALERSGVWFSKTDRARGNNHLEHCAKPDVLEFLQYEVDRGQSICDETQCESAFEQTR